MLAALARCVVSATLSTATAQAMSRGRDSDLSSGSRSLGASVCVGVNGNDFEVVPADERQQRIVGATAGMLTAEAGADAGRLLQKLNSAG